MYEEDFYVKNSKVVDFHAINAKEDCFNFTEFACKLIF